MLGRRPPPLDFVQGVVAQFMAFGGGLVVAAVALKSMDRVLYNLDET
jgi:hypothetical protein